MGHPDFKLYSLRGTNWKNHIGKAGNCCATWRMRHKLQNQTIVGGSRFVKHGCHGATTEENEKFNRNYNKKEQIIA